MGLWNWVGTSNPGVETPGYGIGRPYGTFWAGIAGHLIPIPI